MHPGGVCVSSYCSVFAEPASGQSDREGKVFPPNNNAALCVINVCGFHTGARPDFTRSSPVSTQATCDKPQLHILNEKESSF